MTIALRLRNMTAILAATLVPTSAVSLTWNVDFGDGPLYVGTADAPDLGTVWNAHTSAGGSTPLLDSTGAAGSVAFTLGPSPNWIPLAGANIPANDLMVDGLHSSIDGWIPFSITGLAPSVEYDFWVYGTSTASSSWWGISTPVVSGPAASGGAFGSDVFRLRSNGSGEILGSYCGLCPIIAIPATGFQLATVPGPSSMPLLLSTLVGLGLLRRCARLGTARNLRR